MAEIWRRRGYFPVQFCWNWSYRERRCRELRIDTNAINQRARAMYQKLGYEERGIVPCVFNGIPGVQLVCLEKYLDGGNERWTAEN